MKIFIDDREKQERKTKAVAYYLGEDENFQYGKNLNVSELLYGDYVFTENNITVAFEYKTIEDSMSSLGDNRVFNQALNQSNNFDYHFVIIVGTDKEKQELIKEKERYTGKYMSNEQFYGGFASLLNFTSVIQVPNDIVAFMVMLRIARKCVDDKPILKRFNKSRGSPALRLLANNVHRVGYKTAERICECLDLVTVDDVLGLGVDDLVKVDGVGEVKANSILEQLKREFFDIS